MSVLLQVVFPELPPTSNKIYFKGKILRAEARKYAERFADHMRRHLPEIMRMDPGAIYAVHLRFFFESLVNESWNNPNVAPSKRAKSRYKKIDVTNRIKLLEDCLRDAIGIDDSQSFVTSQEKHQDPDYPRVEIYVQEVRPEWFGIPPVVSEGR